MASPDIEKLILERFGADMSPQARAKVAEDAERKKSSLGVVGGGLLGGLGDVVAGRRPDAAGAIQKRREQIDADTTGKFDEQRKATMESVGASDKLEDRERLRVERGREDTEYGEENDSASQLSGMARDAAAKLGVKVRPDTSYTTIKKVAPWLIDQMKVSRPSAANQWGPLDASYLQVVGDVARGVLPPNTELPTDGVSPKALQLGGQMLGAAKGRDNTQRRWEKPRGDVLERYNNMQSSLSQMDSIGAGLPGWDTGLVKNRADMATWYAGLADPQKAYARSVIGQNLLKAVKAQSGLAVTQFEYDFLQTVLPNMDDDENELFSKLQAYRDFNQRELENHVRNNEQQGGYKFSPDAANVPTPNIQPTGDPSGKDAGKMRFEDAGKKYNIPADKVRDFLAKRPNAKRAQ